MSKKKQIRKIVSELGEHKYSFLNEVRKKVKNYIAKQGSKCLTIIEKRGSYDKRYWHLEASTSYAKVLIAFCQNKKYKGNELDSYLTEPVIDIVTKKYQKFYQKHDEVVASGIFKIVFNRTAFVKSLAESLVNNRLQNSELLQTALKKSSRHLLYHTITDKSSAMIADQIQQMVQHTALDTLTSQTQDIVTNAVSVPIIKTIALIIIKLFAKQIIAIIGKILASTAFKTIILAVMKKFIAAVLLSVIVKGIAAKFSIAVGTAWAFVLLPIIATYIAYSIWTFPETLGEKVSDKIYSELSGNFNDINRDVIKKIVSNITSSGLTDIADALSENAELQASIDKFVLQVISEQ